MTDFLSIILAAGDGTRMNSDLPKVLHKVGGLPMVAHVARAALEAGSSSIALVTAPEAGDVRNAVSKIAPEAQFFDQTERRGTAHAARAARDAWQDATGYVVIVYGDHPLLQPESFDLVLEKLDDGFDATTLAFVPDDPTGYGRLIVDDDNLLDIREQKDASDEELQIGLCNACILAFKADLFREVIDSVTSDNAQNEFYLTDLFRLTNAVGKKATFALGSQEEVMGVNNRLQLATAESIFQDRRRAETMLAGATLLDPGTIYFSYDTNIGRDVTIGPNVVFGPNVSVADGAIIDAFCHIEGADIGPHATIGPFARLRPGAILAEKSKVGNFCEVKNSNIGPGAKVNHLTYIGDADIGARTNIGAGTITCNYDGVSKNRTKIGKDAFIGSNSSLVAPIKIGDAAYVGSGSVITHDVADEALAIGRTRQKNLPLYGPKIKARALAASTKK